MNKDTYTTSNPYTDNGYSSRADYLAELCDEYPADVVHTLADMLGETEDFDGLVTMLEDYEIDNAYDAAYTADDDDDDDDAATGFRDALAARDAAAVLSVRAARDALAEAYDKAGAALDAARDAYAAARDALNAAD